MTLRKLVPLIKTHFKLIADLESMKWGGIKKETDDKDSFNTILSWKD